MLPMPYNQPVTPFYTYPENNPPWIPPYRGHPEAEQFLMPAAAMAANAVTQAAPTSVTRMFCYNLVSSNNWANEMFADLVKLILDGAMLIKNTRGAPGNFYVLLQESVNSYTVLFASHLAAMYPEFMQSVLDPETAQRVYQNANRLQELRRAHEGGYAQPPQDPRDPRQWSSLHMNRPHHHTQVQHGQQAYQSRPGHYQHPGTRHHAAGNPAAAGATVIRSQTPVVDDFVQTKFTTIAKPTLPKEQTMEQKTHAMAYRNTTVSTPANPVRPARQSQEPALPSSFTLTPQFTDAMTFNEMNRETAIQSIEAATSGYIVEEGLVAIPCHVKLHMPIAATTPVKELFAKMKSVRTFAAAGMAFKEIAKVLSEMNPEKSFAKRLGEIWTKKLDSTLTDYVLDFFRKALPPHCVNFDSLAEDGEGLMKYISSFGNGGSESFQAGVSQYQAALFKHLFTADAHSNATVPDMEVGEMAAVDYEILTVNESVFALNMASYELDYGVEGTPEHVNASNTPSSLYQLLIEANKLAKENDSLRQCFLTLDSKRWYFYESAALDRSFIVWQE